MTASGSKSFDALGNRIDKVASNNALPNLLKRIPKILEGDLRKDPRIFTTPELQEQKLPSALINPAIEAFFNGIPEILAKQSLRADPRIFSTPVTVLEEGVTEALDNLDIGIQSTASKGYEAFEVFGKLIQKTASDGSNSFKELGEHIRGAVPLEGYSRADPRTFPQPGIDKKIEESDSGSFGKVLHQWAADWFPGLVDEPDRPGQFNIQDMLNFGRPMSEVEIEKMGRPMSRQEMLLQHKYKIAEMNMEWADFVEKEGGYFKAVLAKIVYSVSTEEERRLADGLAKQRAVEEAHAITSFDPNNVSVSPTWLKEQYYRERAADLDSDEGFKFDELMARKELELYIMDMDPLRRKLETAAVDAVNEAREGKKTNLDGKIFGKKTNTGHSGFRAQQGLERDGK